jgi:hypothetical protein
MADVLIKETEHSATRSTPPADRMTIRRAVSVAPILQPKANLFSIGEVLQPLTIEIAGPRSDDLDTIEQGKSSD